MNATSPSQSYGADPLLVGFWLLLAGIPFPLAAWLIIRDGATASSIELLSASLLGPIAVLVFAARFRAIFHADRFEYRRWGSTVLVRYADIARIETTNVTPIEKQPIGAFIVTHDGLRLPFWPKLFPRAAVERFYQLADHQQSA